MKLYPYKMGSASAKALALSLGIKRIKHDGKPIHVKTVLNWGASNQKRHIHYAKMLNEQGAVARASNKLETFKALDGVVSTPEWTEDREEASKWLEDGVSVVVRHKLNGHSGEGIEIVPHDNLAHVLPYDAPLYTKYIKKKEEYRIHVFEGEAFFVQRKARKKEVPDDQVNWQIRNHANGFIFAHQDVEVPNEAHVQAVDAVRALGLDFGAVDIILGTDKRYYVLEVNTACGLEGTTLEKYVEKFKKYL